MAIAEWQKIDFHTHTPASQCFFNKDVTPIDWVKAVIDSGLDGVVVTDHNSAEWVERIRTAAKEVADSGGKEIAVYPGIELCVSTEHTHVLVIFDPKIEISKVRNFLTECGINDDCLADTEKSVDLSKLQEMVSKYDFLIIPAHFSKNKGLGKLNLSGIIQYSERLPIAAIEVRDEECIKEVENKINNKALRSDVALITGSDNPGSREGEHSIDGFGKQFSWVKIGTHSLESLKMAFLDTSRIKLVLNADHVHLNPSNIRHNYIAGLNISELKHVENLSFRLSPNLNCIVGGRGSGKSTLLEMIRVALHKIENNKLNNANYPLISGVMTEESSVELFYNFGSTSEYKVTVDGKKNRTWIYENDDGVVTDYPDFEAMIFSQKEIFNLIDDDENPTKIHSSPILDIIDDAIVLEKSSINERIASLKRETLDLSFQLRNLTDKLKKIPTIKGNLEVCNNDLEYFKSTGITEKKEKYDILNRIYLSLEKQVSDIHNSLSQIESAGFHNVNNKISIEPYLEENYSDLNDKINNSVLKIEQAFTSAFQISNTEVLDLKRALESSQIKKDLDLAYTNYNTALEDLQSLGIDNYNEVEIRRQRAIQELSDLELLEPSKNELITNIHKNLDAIIEERNKLFDLRKGLIEDIESKAENIKLTIHPMSHGNRWLAQLRKSVGREDKFDTDFTTLKSWLFPDNKLNEDNWKYWCEFLLMGDRSKIDEIKKDNGKELFSDKFDNIWTDIKSLETLSPIFSIQPEDRVQIDIKVNDEEISINEGSPGQKCAAVLALIMNQGTKPLIIDQPEDDLDNSLILDLIVKNIKIMKNHRQIIIVTHNPNIPVLGDAEGIIILDRNPAGKVIFKFGKKTGCIEEKMIKHGICDIMEGGYEAFRKREEKYRSIFS